MNTVLRLLRMALILFIYFFTRVLFRLKVKWLTTKPKKNWKNIRLFIFLNHTSLFEFLFIPAFPMSFLWRCAAHVVLPAADKTMDRPVVGAFFKILVPNIVSISRKRDATWEKFLNNISEESVIAILPEGRMMRPTGLDLQGNPMSARGGVADILEALHEGEIIVAYSGGLHHIQQPGEYFVRPFKNLRMNFECLDIADYKNSLKQKPEAFKAAVVSDLNERLKNNLPKSDFNYPEN